MHNDSLGLRDPVKHWTWHVVVDILSEGHREQLKCFNRLFERALTSFCMYRPNQFTAGSG